ncbi:MAG: hypothetical protein ACE5K4_06345 [Candidatus Hydrothermarchaeota archaeon]
MVLYPPDLPDYYKVFGILHGISAPLAIGGYTVCVIASLLLIVSTVFGEKIKVTKFIENKEGEFYITSLIGSLIGYFGYIIAVFAGIGLLKGYETFLSLQTVSPKFKGLINALEIAYMKESLVFLTLFILTIALMIRVHLHTRNPIKRIRSQTRRQGIPYRVFLTIIIEFIGYGLIWLIFLLSWGITRELIFHFSA